MDVKMGYSGQLSGDAQVSTVRSYYKGAILRVASAAKGHIQIHNCSAAGTPAAANMVAELSVSATDCKCAVDNPTGVIECPDGIRVVKVTGTITYHVRYAIQPG